MAENVEPGERPKEFDTFNAMDRPAMWLEVPILPGIALVISGLVVLVSVGSMFTFKWGAVCCAPFGIGLVALRFMSTIDDRFLRRVGFMLRRKWLDLSNGRPLLLTPYNSAWRQVYGKRYAQQHLIPRENESSQSSLSGDRADPHNGRPKAD